MTPARRSRAKRTRDVYWQRFLKYPRLAMFQSRVELLHAALLEGDPAVTEFVPHPFRLRSGKARDIPGCYLVRGGERIAQAIAARGAFPDTLQRSLEEFFAAHGIRFEVVADAAIRSREIEAQNWLYIVRRLLEAPALDTSAREAALLRRMADGRKTTLGALLGDRGGARRQDEIALFRLLHRGRLRARLASQPLNPATELSPAA